MLLDLPVPVPDRSQQLGTSQQEAQAPQVGHQEDPITLLLVQATLLAVRVGPQELPLVPLWRLDTLWVPLRITHLPGYVLHLSNVQGHTRQRIMMQLRNHQEKVTRRPMGWVMQAGMSLLQVRMCQCWLDLKLVNVSVSRRRWRRSELSTEIRSATAVL